MNLTESKPEIITTVYWDEPSGGYLIKVDSPGYFDLPGPQVGENLPIAIAWNIYARNNYPNNRIEAIRGILISCIDVLAVKLKRDRVLIINRELLRSCIRHLSVVVEGVAK